MTLVVASLFVLSAVLVKFFPSVVMVGVLIGVVLVCVIVLVLILYLLENAM